MLPALITVFGLSMGSFIDALTWRLWRQEGGSERAGVKGQGSRVKKSKKTKKDYSIVSGRSMCESCEHTLAAHDLIPVFSWLSTGGKCRYCGVKIGWHIPLLEVLMAGLFLALYLGLQDDTISQNHEWFRLGSWLVFSVGLVAIAVYDLRHMLIPNRIILPLIAIAGLVTLVEAIGFDGGASAIRDAVLGLLVGGGLFYALFLVSGGRWIGGGDVKLGFFIGIALGPSKALVALWLSFAVALAVILPLMIFKVVKRKQPIPFGPFLIATTLFTAIWGQQLIDWYVDTFLQGLV